ncbi:MAG: GFA family protein [Rhodobacteraceae bacterium]|nr:GFA family protein [Paracoccaceae bacterium]
MDVDGECLCGAIAYKAVVDPERCAICHCQNCQVNSGTAFGWVVHIRDGQFELTRGSLKIFEAIAESGRRRCLSFCGNCGTRIYAQTPEQPDAFFGLRVGTVRQRQLLAPRQQVWCRSAQDWAFDLLAIPRKEHQDG